MNEDMNEELDDIINSAQVDFVIANPDLIGMEKSHPDYVRLKGEYYDYVSQTLMWAAEYFFNVASAYGNAKDLLLEEYTPTQELINKNLGIK